MNNLREQIEALYRKKPWPQFVTAGSMAEAARTANNNVVDDVLDIIEQHDCSDDEGEKAAREFVESITVVCTRPHLDDRDALARGIHRGWYLNSHDPDAPGDRCYSDADAIIAALEEKTDAKD